MIDFKNIFGLFACLLFASIASAQTTAEQSSKFDLVIFGDNLDSNTEVFLNENPGTKTNWQKLDTGYLVTDEKNELTSLLFSNLSTEKFAGQDIRENYIAVKIRPAADSNQNIRVLYALPHVDYSSNNHQKIHAAIQSDPVQMRKHSIANLIFPRPHPLTDTKEFIEHIEMPVRHHKPGVQEVKWLDIIFNE